jgi:hypothetical protein
MPPCTYVLTLEDDSETNNEFPAAPSIKGTRIDQITRLKSNKGLANHQAWLDDLESAFLADPNRYTRATMRVALATSYIDNRMKERWHAGLQRYPHLRSHWRKFLRWARLNHLHGEAEYSNNLQRWHSTTQRENESPYDFYTRLTSIGLEIGEEVRKVDFQPRLADWLQKSLIRNNRLGQTLQELLSNAQEVWLTYQTEKPAGRNKKDGPGHEDSLAATGRPLARSSASQDRSGRRDSRRDGRGNWQPTSKVSDDERRRREEQGLCYQCGKPGHMAKECYSRTQATGTTQMGGRASSNTNTARVSQSTRSGQRAEAASRLDEEPASKRQKNE